MGLFNLRRRHEQEDALPEVIEGMGAESMGAEGTGADTGVASGTEVLNTLKHFGRMHHLDPNLPIEELNDVDNVINTGNVEKGVTVEHGIMEDNSPYPEVRASVRNYDEDLPANTIRAWVIGLVLCTVGSGVNMLFSLRNPSVSVTTYVIQLIAYPIGLLWDLIFPDRVWNVFGVKFNLKPGKFNYKEHVIIVVMSNVRPPLPSPPCFSTPVLELTSPFLVSLRLPMVVVLSTPQTLSLPSRSGTSSSLAGAGRCSSASPRSAPATVLLACRAASSCGPLP